jgi:uncharacterized protein (DUF2147 family)
LEIYVTSVKALTLSAVLALVAGQALAASPRGTWRVQDGSGSVRIAACGRHLCGYTPDGQVVLRNMASQGPNSWAGTMIDIRGGGTNYSGTMSLVTDDTLRVQGCVPGGNMCGSETWARMR